MQKNQNISEPKHEKIIFHNNFFPRYFSGTKHNLNANQQLNIVSNELCLSLAICLFPCLLLYHVWFLSEGKCKKKKIEKKNVKKRKSEGKKKNLKSINYFYI